MLYPQDVDDALSKHLGEDWRTRDFDADIFIDGQSYNIKHSLLRRAILTIDDTDYHSDQWTFG
jgi:hypothetical protein